VIRDINREIAETGQISYKHLESGGGFLIYVSRTYTWMRSYIKGIYLTLNSWRPDRDAEGWKILGQEDRELMEWAEERGIQGHLPAPQSWGPTAPDSLRPVKRLLFDMRALTRLTDSPVPPVLYARTKMIMLALYGRGDASGSGFGGIVPTRNGVMFRHGIWTYDVSRASSNFREFRNLVDGLEKAAEDGGLKEVELFLGTDNQVAENAYYKGSSGNKELDEQVLRLKRIEAREGMRLHFFHIAGTRMIELGIDGLSRGSLMEGAMAGTGMLVKMPLNLSAFERVRGSKLLNWFRNWMCASNQLIPLKPEQWFFEGHGLALSGVDSSGVWMPRESQTKEFLWAPPPAVADAALDELQKARHKRLNLLHVFVCPRLLAPMWRRGLHREADLVFEIPAGNVLWPASSHEPLIVGVCLPFTRHRPWQLWQTPKLLGIEWKLRQMFKTCEGDPGNLLRELRQLPRKLDSMPEGVVWQMLHPTS